MYASIYHLFNLLLILVSGPTNSSLSNLVLIYFSDIFPQLNPISLQYTFSSLAYFFEVYISTFLHLLHRSHWRKFCGSARKYLSYFWTKIFFLSLFIGFVLAFYISASISSLSACSNSISGNFSSYIFFLSFWKNVDYLNSSYLVPKL